MDGQNGMQSAGRAEKVEIITFDKSEIHFSFRFRSEQYYATINTIPNDMRHRFLFGFVTVKVRNKRIHQLFICDYMFALLVLHCHSLEHISNGRETMNWAKKIRQIKMTLKREIAKI